MDEQDMQMWHQMEQEHEQLVFEALQRAEKKEATEEDWKILYFECGLRRQ